MDDSELHIEMDLHSFTHSDRSDLLSELPHAIDNAGGWVLEQNVTSLGTVDLLMEVQASALPNAYAALIESGLELSRESHRKLVERCNCSLHLRPTASISSILTIRLGIHFQVDPSCPRNLSRLLLMGGATA
jgi:hypothetical protein